MDRTWGVGLGMFSLSNLESKHVKYTFSGISEKRQFSGKRQKYNRHSHVVDERH